jgi:chemotaxis protein MotB
MSKIKKANKAKDDGLPIWMATFADMMTLLFAFFVLLFSMATIDPVKVSAMQDAMIESTEALAIEGSIQKQKERMMSINKIKENLEEIVDSLDLGDDATISSDPRGVILEIEGDICFPSLSSDLDLRFIDLLKVVSKKVMSHPYDKRTVIIEGHSDSSPIKPDQKYHKNSAVKAIEVWRTNRHLSSARASEVVEFLVDSLDIHPGRLVAAGYGEFWPFGASWNDVKSGAVNSTYIAKANTTVEQRNKNRRVKIIFSKN